MMVPAVKGTVVIYAPGPERVRLTHEAHTHADVAKMLARLKDYEFAGYYENSALYSGRLFFVPHDTLVGSVVASQLGIRGPKDLFGGLVPYEFVRTKAIAHDVIGARACRPVGWSEGFAARVDGVTLPGYTAFSVPDAHAAATRLLKEGACRVKRTRAAGGRGQRIVTTLDQLHDTLRDIDSQELSECGVVLEMDLEAVTTYSVGLVALDDMSISYYGLQRLTRNNEGRSVYGGSALVVVKGGFERLLALDLTPALRLAIRQAIGYDAAMQEYPDFMASRRNYDVGQGIDGQGRPRSGVFEHSWRIGGASGAEAAALQAFADDQSLQLVEASTVEEYGDGIPAPPSATIHFRGVDAEAGPVMRYTVITRTHPRVT
jgi:Protein of unknown function (DUF3182)